MSEPFKCSPSEHRYCIASAMRRAEDLCRKRKARLTPIRRQVLELVWQQHRPVGAYDLLEQLQKQGRVAPPTVYRALDFLQQQGLIHRLESLNAFIGCDKPDRPHYGHFLICTNCNSLAEIDEPEIARAISLSAQKHGFHQTSQMVETLGLCNACQEEKTQHA